MELVHISLYMMSGLYILAGINHFIMPELYLKIMPKWVPYPIMVNLFVGVAEVFLGFVLLSSTYRPLAAWGIIILLIAIFPANIHHFQRSRRKGKGVWLTLIRLPLQFLLIYWAYLYT
ncbi:putative membrane protein [Catalinimonas alkaloidigena]|uniref:DoxX family protein n=1 Tax=Catalinimonas alkaloidigena TaxID=1075417 RepID=UPI002404EF22|nr:DoxX family protein [Catalinimonas alkaloidigena]MDF9797478.1 putative membrane protein [Catalinimonas alkaloidigena]